MIPREKDIARSGPVGLGGLECPRNLRGLTEPSWSPRRWLHLEQVLRFPTEAGVLVLSRRGPHGVERDVWVEEADNLRDRLEQMLYMPQSDPIIERLLQEFPRPIRVRALRESSPDRRTALVARLRATLAPAAEPFTSS